jgi:hypothetical protein
MAYYLGKWIPLSFQPQELQPCGCAKFGIHLQILRIPRRQGLLWTNYLNFICKNIWVIVNIESCITINIIINQPLNHYILIII